MSSTSFSASRAVSLARNAGNGSAGINSTGWAIILSSSLRATPMRLVPWSRARMRIKCGLSVQLAQCLFRRAHRFFDICHGMRGRKKAGLKLRGCQIDALLQHALEVFLEAFAITLHCVCQIVDGFCGEVSAEHRAAAIELNWNASRDGSLPQTGLEGLSKLLELAVSITGRELFQSRNPSGHGNRIST